MQNMEFEAVSPEEQKQYDALVKGIADIVHGEKQVPLLAEQLKQGQPEGVAAQAAFDAVVGLDAAMGGEMPEDMIVPVAYEGLEMILELALELGIIQDIEQAMRKGMAGLNGLLSEHYGADEEDYNDLRQFAPNAEQALGGQNGIA